MVKTQKILGQYLRKHQQLMFNNSVSEKSFDRKNTGPLWLTPAKIESSEKSINYWATCLVCRGLGIMMAPRIKPNDTATMILQQVMMILQQWCCSRWWWYCSWWWYCKNDTATMILQQVMMILDQWYCRRWWWWYCYSDTAGFDDDWKWYCISDTEAEG